MVIYMPTWLYEELFISEGPKKGINVTDIHLLHLQLLQDKNWIKNKHNKEFD